MTKPVVPKKAAVQLTAGTGFRNENSVAARFLLDLLAGSNTLGADFGRISRIHWQGRDLGWLADDLVVACSDSGGDRSAGISIKSAQQVTGGGFPANFVGIAWAQWLGVETERALQSRDDTLVLMTGSLAHDVADAWSNMLGDALRTTPDRMVARLAEPEAGEGSQSSAIQRALFESLHCPDKLKSAGDTGHEATVRLLCHIRLLSFDFEATTSHDHGRALRNCQEILRSGNADDAARLWSRLIEIADARRAGGSIDLAGLLAELRDQFDFRDHPDYRRDWESLHRSSQDAMADVRTQVADLPPLARDTERAEIEEILDRDRACFLVGESGSGKSALAKQIAETRYGRCVWFADAALDYDNEAAFERGTTSLIRFLRSSALRQNHALSSLTASSATLLAHAASRTVLCRRFLQMTAQGMSMSWSRASSNRRRRSSAASSKPDCRPPFIRRRPSGCRRRTTSGISSRRSTNCSGFPCGPSFVPCSRI
jgi:hypothetical protein